MPQFHELPTRERANLQVIDSLNQRGGRMLSVVDLLEHGNLDLNMAAYLLQRLQRGASLVTAARPGAAGKTAVMGALLALTPPGGTLEVVTSGAVRGRPDSPRPRWRVCHELGSGRYYGYLWGREVDPYLQRQAEGDYIATNLHADTCEEVAEILSASPLSVRRESWLGIDLLLPLRVVQHGGETRRRVQSLWASDGGDFRELWRWEPEGDTFQRLPGAPAEGELAFERECLQGLWTAGKRELSAFRKALLECLR